MHKNYFIDPDIKKAETLPGSFYSDQEVFETLKEKVFLKSWQWIGDEDLVPLSETVYPFILLDHFLPEPMLLSRDKADQIRCLSNVCTHRGNLVVQHPGKVRELSCSYHGRRFGIDGSFKMMPEFSEAENFPRPCDSLHEFPIKKWGSFLFTGLEPAFDFSEIIDILNQKIGFLPMHEFKRDDNLSKDYLVNCHWALYCDNFLEGFHIPFVHADLNSILDYGNYTIDMYDHVNVQTGYSNDSEDVFELPKGHVDFGKKVAAYYFWIFPNMMFNFYPWGLSVNIIKPLGLNKTKVKFITYVYDEEKLNSGAGAILDKVEREDEFVVESVHKGLQSRIYTTGRFSPIREKGVHHFHSLLAKYLSTTNLK